MRLFFFNDTATTEIYTLSLHDALPISSAPAESDSRLKARSRADWKRSSGFFSRQRRTTRSSAGATTPLEAERDRKSTRLNSSHANISYAVFCLKKKNYDEKLIRSYKPN